jgi:hypothetical protein
MPTATSLKSSSSGTSFPVGPIGMLPQTAYDLNYGSFINTKLRCRRTQLSR